MAYIYSCAQKDFKNQANTTVLLSIVDWKSLISVFLENWWNWNFAMGIVFSYCVPLPPGQVPGVYIGDVIDWCQLYFIGTLFPHFCLGSDWLLNSFPATVLSRWWLESNNCLNVYVRIKI